MNEAHSTMEANASVIAAAPDMYEALKTITEWGATTGSDRDLLQSMALKALAKARGEPK